MRGVSLCVRARAQKFSPTAVLRVITELGRNKCSSWPSMPYCGSSSGNHEREDNRKDNRSAKRICWFCCCVEFFRERFNLKSFFRLLVGFGDSGACIFVVAWKSVPDFCSLKEVSQTVHIAPHNVVIVKQCCVNCPLCDLRYENKTNKTKQMKEKEDSVFVISP